MSEEVVERVKYSVYQEAIFDTVLTTDKNIVVNATAGSGKTFTAVEISQLIPTNKKVAFLAFNNSIVEELSMKLAPHIKCATLHSLGMNILMNFYKARLIVNEFKTFRFSEKYLKHLDRKEKFRKQFLYRDVLDKMRMTMASINNSSIMNIAEYYDIPIELEDTDNIESILEDMKVYNYFLGTENNVIDFTDMIYLPVTQERLKLPRYDFTIIDELQDLNKCQQDFVKKLIGDKGRFIGLGDIFQCIYSFLGSDPGSFKSFATLPNTIELPLSISYRCSKAVTKEAQKICPTIEAFERAEDGKVREGEFDEIKESDFILCRNNRPLVFAYFLLIQRGLKCTIRGKDIEQGLVNLIIKWKNKSTEIGIQKLNEELAVRALKLKDKGISKPQNNPAYVMLLEKINTIKMIIDFKRFAMMDQVINFIEEIFNDDREGVQLMTIHKSKGLESENVFLIESFEGKKLIPSQYATQPWELEQEKNLLFVAITRAKKKLVYLTLD